MSDKTSFVYLRVPEAAWATLEETLEMDSHSSAFDSKLRDEISAALDQVKNLGDKGPFVDQPLLATVVVEHGKVVRVAAPIEIVVLIADKDLGELYAWSGGRESTPCADTDVLTEDELREKRNGSHSR